MLCAAEGYCLLWLCKPLWQPEFEWLNPRFPKAPLEKRVPATSNSASSGPSWNAAICAFLLWASLAESGLGPLDPTLLGSLKPFLNSLGSAITNMEWFIQVRNTLHASHWSWATEQGEAKEEVTGSGDSQEGYLLRSGLAVKAMAEFLHVMSKR